ncbi:MAG: aldehyde dehydrogenase [Caldisericia bacterium]|nr:aldehyde dehydrogenase [Caldisericia bacterium]MDD4614513.1 aldehyde dehydrogenase [Caldisericia bacterium]
MDSIAEIFNKQREFFRTAETRPLECRKQKLLALRKAITLHEAEICKALSEDLKKSSFESYVTEIAMVLQEISFMLSNMHRYLQPKRVRAPITQFPSSCRVYKEPYGNVLIISPWNYPFHLAMVPLVGAIACGNCAIVKPSEYSPATTKVIQKMIQSIYPSSFVDVIQGGVETAQCLLDKPFDMIFFTGSTTVGKIVLEKAAKHLTPVVLELGGKCPCIVDETANIKLAAKRIAWGKCLNAGQTCVAPDYLLVHSSIKHSLIDEIQKNITLFYTEHPENHPDYPAIISDRHYQRLTSLLRTEHVIWGGHQNQKERKISPALVDKVSWEDPLMQEEIFGPLLPILSFENLSSVVMEVSKKSKPLALYLFTTSKTNKKIVVHNCSFGGGCINDVIVHLASDKLPFGGVGESGMGRYHGIASLDAFSHSKGILHKSNLLDIPFRYPPYEDKLRLVKKFLK